MTNSVLKKLRRKLPSNGADTIAKKTAYTVSYVNMVLNNIRNNQDIIDCAIKVAADYQEELKLQTETINSL